MKARSKSARIAAQLADLRMPGALGGPAPVAPPPPRRLPKSVQFSIVRSVQFSTVIDTRFLILPWIRLPCLASHLLACVERQLSRDWQDRYKTCPVLLETFCETPRFARTCYRAANWTLVGQTQGRGKLDTRHEYAKPVKNIFVKPLCPDWKAILNR